MLRLKHYYWTARKIVNRYRCKRLPPGGRLHVGCGPVHLPGWINIDVRRYDAADFIWDVRDGLPFIDLAYIFAEHFIEHLPYWEARRFFRDCRRALDTTGVLRVSTPNLHWVHTTQYRPNAWRADEDAITDCFSINTAFRGWGHQFLYNRQTLSALLRDAGFATVNEHAYGESQHQALRGIEHHDQSPDAPDAPHVLVVEASGSVDPSTGLGNPEADFFASLGAS